PTVRGSFDIVIPWEASIAMATEVTTQALSRHEGIEASPAPRTLVESIEQGGVRLRTYFWFPSHGIDRAKLMSDMQLATKVALQQAGIPQAQSPGPVIVAATLADTAPRRRDGAAASTPPGPTETQKLEAAIQRDSVAASVAASQLPEDQENEIGHALENAEQSPDEEGRNLIADRPPRPRPADEPGS
ncbi:MAG: mechanosensitive ion channel family protein, partial [Planctomycetes bacterium]|nr:mechanosensitive ion channel family protein [Planctomycetota bacterium]